MGHLFRGVGIALVLSSIGCGPNFPPSELLPVGTGAGAGGGSSAGGGAGGGEGGGAGGGSMAALSFANDVMPVLKAKCAGCHMGSYEQPAIALSRLKANTGMTGACVNTPRIVVNNGAESLLVKKLLGTAECGAVMPLVKLPTMTVACTGEQCVAAADIEKVKHWIDQGALDN